jgi:hypothetical protein
MTAAKPTEHEIQREFVAICHKLEPEYPALRLLFAVPNGGYRTQRTAARMKLEGVRSGVPDMCLPVPSGNFAGLWLEFKTSTGALSQSQKDFHQLLQDNYHQVAVVRSVPEALQTLKEYLG